MSSTTVLDYVVQPTKYPVYTSVQDNPNKIGLVITVTNHNSYNVTVTKLQIVIPANGGQTDLISDSGTVQATGQFSGPSNSNWLVNPPSGGNTMFVLPMPLNQPSPTTVVFQPGDQLVITLSEVDIDTLPGTATVVIGEQTDQGTAHTQSPVGDITKVQSTLSAVITMNPEKGIITPGSAIMFSWTSTDATSGTIFPLNYPIPTTQLAKGSYSDTPSVTQTYTFVFQGKGPDVTQQLDVTVANVYIRNVLVEPTTVGQGGQVTISWDTNADSVTLDKGDGTPSLPGVTSPQTFTIEQTTQITLTASLGGGTPVQEQRQVTVGAPQILSFGSNKPQPVEAGSAVVLSWSTLYAETVSIDQGIGDQTNNLNHNVTVNPQNNTTYTLTCTGLGGNVTQTCAVTVIGVSIDTPMVATPSTIDPNGSSTLTWKCSRATSATINGQSVDPNAGLYDVTPNPSQDTDYVLVCQGPNGPVQSQVTVSVNSPNFTDVHVQYGGDCNAVIWWSTKFATEVQLYDPTKTKWIPVAINGSYNAGQAAYTDFTYNLKVSGDHGSAETSVTVQNCGF